MAAAQLGIRKQLKELLVLLRSRKTEENNQQIDVLPSSQLSVFDCQDSRHGKEIDKVSPLPNRRNKVLRRISIEYVEERRSKGICLFCDEPETPDHHLRHKNSGLLVINVDENGSHMAESSCVTDPMEQDSIPVKKQEVIESNPQETLKDIEAENHQVPVTSSEPSLKIVQESMVVVDCFTHQADVDEVSVVGESDEQSQFHIVDNVKQCAHQLFDKMSVRRNKMHQKKKSLLAPKSWRFKFKTRSKRGEESELMLCKIDMRERSQFKGSCKAYFPKGDDFDELTDLVVEVEALHIDQEKLGSQFSEDTYIFPGVHEAKANAHQAISRKLLSFTGRKQQQKKLNVTGGVNPATKQKLRVKKKKMSKSWHFKYKWKSIKRRETEVTQQLQDLTILLCETKACSFYAEAMQTELAVKNRRKITMGDHHIKRVGSCMLTGSTMMLYLCWSDVKELSMLSGLMANLLKVALHVGKIGYRKVHIASGHFFLMEMSDGLVVKGRGDKNIRRVVSPIGHVQVILNLEDTTTNSLLEQKTTMDCPSKLIKLHEAFWERRFRKNWMFKFKPDYEQHCD